MSKKKQWRGPDRDSYKVRRDNLVHINLNGVDVALFPTGRGQGFIETGNRVNSHISFVKEGYVRK